jgi:hypothetical protein
MVQASKSRHGGASEKCDECMRENAKSVIARTPAGGLPPMTDSFDSTSQRFARKAAKMLRHHIITLMIGKSVL